MSILFPATLVTFVLGMVFFLGTNVTAQEKREPMREIFVPSCEMATILENCKDRVLLNREEYESLLSDAIKIKPEQLQATSPVDLVLLSSDSKIRIKGEQATIQTVLTWESHTDTLMAVPIPLKSVAVCSAMLDGEPAKLGFMPESLSKFTSESSSDSAEPVYHLFLQGSGQHTLELNLTTALVIDSVRQELKFSVPSAPRSMETLEVSGDVELKSGAMVVRRKIEDGVTRFELLPDSDEQHLVLTRNSHQVSVGKSILAKNVQFVEVTGSYEKLYAAFSLDILHQATEQMTFIVPDRFEMTNVQSPQLARWSVKKHEEQSVLEVIFSEPVTGTVSLNLAAVRFFGELQATEMLSQWSFPTFVPQEVDGYSVLLGLLLDTQWNVQKLSTSHLNVIQVHLLESFIPKHEIESNADAPKTRMVAAWYAPLGENWNVLGEFSEPKAVSDVVSHMVLTLNDKEETLRGLFQVTPRHEKIFAMKIAVPEHWKVTRMTGENETPLPFEYRNGTVHVRLKNGMTPGSTFPVFFEASGNTEGWFGSWDEKKMSFPAFQLTDATNDTGTIAVKVDDDMLVTPENATRLVPLDNKERTEFLAGIPVDLAYQYLSRPYSMEMTITRATPRITAQTFSFFRFAPSLMVAKYEIHYLVDHAKTRSLSFLLPSETPENIGIHGLRGLDVKEYTSKPVTLEGKEYRRWDVTLTDPRSGDLRIAVDFEQSMDEEKQKMLPQIKVDHVAWQSGLVTLEGHEELDISILPDSTIRPVDVGELVVAEYIPGRRLLGVYGGATDQTAFTVDIKRNPTYELPVSLIQLARAEVEIDANGKRITKATYDLKTRSTFLMIDLAENEEIWSISLDHRTIKPQKSGHNIVVDVPAQDDAAVRELEIIWATAGPSFMKKRCYGLFNMLGLKSFSEIRFPDLWIPSHAKDSGEKTDWQKVPVTRLAWNVTAPPGFEIVRIGDKSLGDESLIDNTPQPFLVKCLQGILGTTEETFLMRKYFLMKPAFLGEESSYRPSLPSEDRRSDGRYISPKPTEEPSAIPLQKRTLDPVQPVQVNFQQNLSAELQRHLQFQVIGESDATRLVVKMVNTRLVSLGVMFIWGVVLAMGMVFLKCSARTKGIFLLAITAAGTFLVLIPGLEIYAPVFDHAVYAALSLLLFYILTGTICMIIRIIGRQFVSKTMVMLAALLIFLSLGNLHADNPASNPAGNSVEQPIVPPNDCVVAFYDVETLQVDPLLKNGFPDPRMLTHPDQKLLVPYAKYMELWNLVHPEKKIETPEALPVEYAVSSGKYEATLATTDELPITGNVEIEIFADNPVLIPLPVVGGILSELTVDEKPSELAFSEKNGGIFLLRIHGKGKHQLRFTARFKIERQGGWRQTVGKLPAFPVHEVTLELPEKQMEFRCGEVSAQRKWESQTAGEKITTTLAPGGDFQWSWRFKVSEAEIDQSLTADSELQFNIQEGMLLLDWELTLTFRRGKYESSRLKIPADYLVVSIDGENVRGWSNIDTDESGRALIDVEFLHPAENEETLNVILMKKIDFSSSQETWQTIFVPNVSVVGAAMHHGRFLIQRSSRLNVKTTVPSGVTLVDLADLTNVPDGGETPNPAVKRPFFGNPLGMESFQAYRFTSEEYQIPLEVNTPKMVPAAVIQTLVRMGQNEIKMESQVVLTVADRQYYTSRERYYIFHERFILPKGFRLNSVLSKLGLFEWSTRQLESGESELAVFWPNTPMFQSNVRGENQPASFYLQGTMMVHEGEENTGEETDLPVFNLVDRDDSRNGHSLHQEFVIQADPSFDVEVHDLKHAEIPRDLIPSWVVPEQHSLCRQRILGNDPAALPSARLKLVPRTPVITCESITNVRLSSKSIEETILLDYDIQNAGVRCLQFELPKEMTDARIEAPLLKRKELKETEHSILVTLELQDEIMNELRVLIRNDRRLLVGPSYQATIPKMLTGKIMRQYVVLENSGRLDEMIVDSEKLKGLRKLGRQQKEWAELASLLGDGATEAYLVTDPDESAISFHMLRHETVKMSGAQIGLAETRLVLGENGDYRAEQIYRIDNKTEQYLDLLLPKNSEIWTARILTPQEWGGMESGLSGDFGQPVKPTSIPNDSRNEAVRIPIVKTEVGDLDYVVRIVYAGKNKKFGALRKTDMPFIEVLNIPVSASMVRLYLPEDYHFRFDGTMRKADQTDFQHVRSEYDKQVDAKLRQTLQIGNPYEQARAMNNLKMMPQQSLGQSSSYPLSGRRPGYEMQLNTPSVASSTMSPMMQQPEQQFHGENPSNSVIIEERFQNQSNSRSQNVAIQAESNWKKIDDQSQRDSQVPMSQKPGQRPSVVSNKRQMESLEQKKTVTGRAGEGDSPQYSKFEATQSSKLDATLASKLSSPLSNTAPVPQESQQSMSLGLQQPQQFYDATRNSSSELDNVQVYQQRHMEQNMSVIQQSQSSYSAESASAFPAPSSRDHVVKETEENMSDSSGLGKGSGPVMGGMGMGGTMSGSGGMGGMGGGMGGRNMSEVGENRPRRLGTPATSMPATTAGLPVDLPDTEMNDAMNNDAMNNDAMNVAVMGQSPIARRLASLDIEIPQTGKAYLFTAPQSEHRLSLSGMSLSSRGRLTDFALATGILLVVTFLGMICTRKRVKK